MGVSAVPGAPRLVSSERCQCVDDLLAPIRSKMKVLKKIKKRIGLSPRSCNGGVNNLPPILFHQVHGDNVRISHDGAVARRVESFCRGVTFTNRPIKIQEKVYLKFLEVSTNWSGVLRFGFTSTDPSTLRYSLPKYACPDLTNKPGYWAKALAERFADRGTILYFYVTAAGDVHFGINGEEKGIFFSGVDTRAPLWGLFDIYGNSTGIELLTNRTQLNNFRRGPSEEVILPALQSLCLTPSSEELPAESRYHAAGHLALLPFHKTRGQNIRLSNDRCVATRCDTEFCHGYVFTARPIRLEEKLVVQVLATESMYVGALAFGLTSCDPAVLAPCELPEDADALLDRREYWVVNKDVASIPQRGDELEFSVSASGEVCLSKNGGPPVVFMHVDHTLQLWAFFDVYGSTQKIRLVGALQPTARPELTRVRSGLSTPVPAAPSIVSINGMRHCCMPPSMPSPSTVPPASAELLQIQPSIGGGTVLVVNLPPAQSNLINQQGSRAFHSHTPPHTPTISTQSVHHVLQQHPQHETQHDRSATLLSNVSSTYIEPVSAGSYSTMDSMGPWLESATAGGTTAGSECSICYERAIDSVLYVCGHMCMCYECAVQQWRGKGGGHCPLCRAVIRDVIRTYKS